MPHPNMGAAVHYMALTSPINEGTEVACTAAIVTDTEFYDPADPTGSVCVAVLGHRQGVVNFVPWTPRDEITHAAGTWHWPEPAAPE